MKAFLETKLQEFSGAFLFGIPMLYTMEMWWIGKSAETWKLLLFLLLAFGICVLISYFDLKNKPKRLRLSVMRAVDSLAVGIVSALVMLLVLNQINLGTSPSAIAGMIIIQSVPLSIGSAAAYSLLSIGESKNRDGDGDDEEQEGSVWRATLNDIGATMAGSIFIGLPVAPSNEIPVLAADMTMGHEISLVLLSLMITYALVFESGFNQQENRSTGLFQRPLTETVMAFVVALSMAWVSLYLFDVVALRDPLPHVLSHVIILGLPAAIGGAVGRLVI